MTTEFDDDLTLAQALAYADTAENGVSLTHREAHATIHTLRARIRELEAHVADYEDRLSTEMPPDFKDWHENSRREWPEVATAVLKMRRERIEELDARRPKRRRA